MNSDTKAIARQLGVELDIARQVQDRMEVDFSECTEEEFRAEVLVAYAKLRGNYVG